MYSIPDVTWNTAYHLRNVMEALVVALAGYHDITVVVPHPLTEQVKSLWRAMCHQTNSKEDEGLTICQYDSINGYYPFYSIHTPIAVYVDLPDAGTVEKVLTRTMVPYMTERFGYADERIRNARDMRYGYGTSVDAFVLSLETVSYISSAVQQHKEIGPYVHDILEVARTLSLLDEAWYGQYTNVSPDGAVVMEVTARHVRDAMAYLPYFALQPRLSVPPIPHSIR